MKSLLIIILACVPVLTNASPQSVYNKLVKANGVKRIPLVIAAKGPGNCSLACTNGQRILITQTLLNVVRNEDELAGVIGHEMAHQIHNSELRADVLGLKYAQRAGYSYCRAAQLLKLYEADSEHPSGSVRYKNTGCK